MDKFLKKIREGELEPNQNDAFPEEISSTSSGQKNKNSDVKKMQQKLSFVRIYFHCGCHKTYSVALTMWRKAIQSCYGASKLKSCYGAIQSCYGASKLKGPDGRCFHAAWAVSKSVH